MEALRLEPGDELMSGILSHCFESGLSSAFIATCVGSLTSLEIRLANADREKPNEIMRIDDKRFEIVSLVGTISPDGPHIHISVADATGTCLGGHLISATIFTTAEIVLGTVPSRRFRRVFDDATGFDELVVDRRLSSFAVGTALLATGSLLLVLAAMSRKAPR